MNPAVSVARDGLLPCFLKGGYIGDSLGFTLGLKGIMQNRMETTIYCGYIGDYTREYYRGY